ncbi:MAG: flagellar biosynthetic protein FliQ, partial [Alphaproteobacteria bacterium]
MTGAEVLDVARDGVITLLKVAGPLMMVALLVGLAVALLQALTQVQEITLVFVPKIVAMFLAL